MRWMFGKGNCVIVNVFKEAYMYVIYPICFGGCGRT